ncbi:MAG: pentapeptide repeat-containing protein, partial [Nocardioides sp.]|nr:pentapeptide repeat-containing protein [Nocardioides sp.]
MPIIPELRSDCSQCFALCCVLLPFSAESGFGVTKPGGTPCLNLADDDTCRIHATLRADGWPGCTVFECFGAGQQVSQVTYKGVSWREGGNLAEMAAVLSVVRVLHEMLAHLTEAARRGEPAAPEWIDRLAGLVAGTPEDLLAVDLDELRDPVGEVLARASA